MLPLPSRLLVIALSFLGSGFVASRATAESISSDPGTHSHDGFYLRLSIGAGAVKAKFSGSDSTPDARGSGSGAMLDVLIGGTPASGLVVGGGYQFDMAQHADYDFGNATGSSANVARGVIGPFVEWYPDREGGFSTGALFGPAVLTVQTPSVRILGTELGGDATGTGIGGNLWVSYTFWIASQWSLGAEARAGFASVKNQDDSSQTGSGTGFALLFTSVYH